MATPDTYRWSATCCMCRRTAPLAVALEEGWTPEWWVGDECKTTPVCTACTERYLVEDENGEMVLATAEALNPTPNPETP